jgi:hypothetical protein
VQVLGDHRAMQVEIHALDTAGPLEAIDDHSCDALVCIAGDVRRGACRRPCGGDEPMRSARERVDRAGDRQVDAGHGVEQVVALAQWRPAAAAREIIERRLARRKGVGLVPGAALRAAPE